ncbi:MAG: phenylalanine--tRNA ligase subunit beta, partial [Armatimonadetes bacterium]|nr:phenylalanine--tRNA ligase subunit beta [Armatimonadota bacterium]
GGPPEPGVRIEIEAPDLCARYVGRVIRGVTIGPSPEWLRRRLEAAGLRAINNVVDVTNYVMWELGQPLHAFDLNLLAGRRILVRRARPGEAVTLIDGTEAHLGPENLVIADGERAVAVAGVMGGRDSEVSPATVDLLLESAYFNPVSVRRTSKRIGVASAASYRFERGTDPNGCRTAADRAAALIQQLAGGQISASVWDVYPDPISPQVVPFRPDRCRALLGIAVPDGEAREYLERLGMEVETGDPAAWQVRCPTVRPDLEIEEDLIEEVGRLYGYDRLPETLPAGATGAGALSPLEQLTRTVREQLLAQGLFEAVTNTLTSRAWLAGCRLELSPVWPAAARAAPVPLRNPLSDQAELLRPSLLPGLLQAAHYNLRHGTDDIFLFETGYGNAWTAPDGPRHRVLVGGLLLGSRTAACWNPEGGPADFYTARGVVEALLAALGAPSPAIRRLDHPAFHPGRSAWLELAKGRLGVVGELHPEVAAALDLPRGVYLFELDGERLLACEGDAGRYYPPSRFPRALRDLAVVVDRSVESARIEGILAEELAPWVRRIRLFDVYTGPPLAPEQVSLAYRLELGAEDRTLTDDLVDPRLDAARNRLAAELSAAFRG